MNERVLRVLEYNKIIDQLVELAATSLGKQLAEQAKPKTDFQLVQTMQQETDEAAQIIRLNQQIPLGGIFDIRASVKRATIGGVLDASSCLEIASTIAGSRNVKRFIENMEDPLPLLSEYVTGISIPHELEKNINQCIDQHGEVLDHASSKLRSIRASIRTYENRIREQLENYTRRNSHLLSDAIITIRNDRYVLPVKQEHRGTVGGIVHDQSSSGQTLFMEPRSVVNLNNQLREAKLQEQHEIERILRELSEQVAAYEAELLANIEILAEIDFIYARAKLAQRMNASKPKLNQDGFISMKQARHPLIPADEVVSNDFEIGKTYNSMLITGPNTGGKTVVLKMVGLFTLMAQSGLQIPALDGCELAVFENVFADIGDEQSIEQNLSTFSSHMTNIVDIMKEVNEQTLVLFDELGAGTDPQEGAALAMAILDEVISRNARVIATTHYPELKAYGYNRKNVVNASVEFDVNTLQPTYRLLIGIPGRSNAFEISKRLGLDTEIIDQAKSLIGIDTKNVENMIMSLERSQKQAEQAYEEAYQILLQSEKLHQDLKREWDNFNKERERLYRKAEEKAKKAVENARLEAERIVKEIRDMQASFKEHEWIEAKRRLEEATPELLGQTNTKQDSISPPPKNLKPGDSVLVRSLNQTGTIVEKIKENEYLVQIGIMKVNINQADLQLADEPKQEQRSVVTVKGNQHVGVELDLRGERYDDAMSRLEKYIDDALLANHPKVRIIHGKGTGALRNGVWEFAKNHPHITSYKYGGPNEGGSGVTVIEFA